MPIPGAEGLTVAAYKGTTVRVPLDTVLNGLPLEWKYAGWEIMHQVQRKTIQHPRCVDHSMEGGITNAVYTNVSRMSKADQVVRVLPPHNAQGPLLPTELQATPSEALIKARIKRYAVEDRRKG